MLAISSRRQGGRRTVRRASSLALIEATDLPDDVLALLDQDLLALGGTYGDPRRATMNWPTPKGMKATVN